MKVLFIVPDYPSKYTPINSLFLKDQAMALSNSGIEVCVSAIIPISLRQAFRNLKILFRNEIIEENQVWVYRHYYLRIPRLKKPNFRILNYLGKRQLKRIIKEKGCPDIAHGHVYSVGYLLSWLKSEHKVPFVITEHFTGYARGIMSNWQMKLAEKTFENSEANIAVSFEFSKLLNSMTGKEFLVVPNVVDTDFFIPKEKKNDSPFVFLNVAHLHPKKNHSELIMAFSSLYKGNNNFFLKIGGGGPELEKLQVLVRKLGVEKQVKLIGPVKREAVRELMHGADCFVLTSKYETFGVVLIEAMSCGLPVVSTRSGGPESIIVDSKLGILCQNNYDGIEKGLKELPLNKYSNDDIRSFIVKNYSEKAFSEKIASVYQKALAK